MTDHRRFTANAHHAGLQSEKCSQKNKNSIPTGFSFRSVFSEKIAGDDGVFVNVTTKFSQRFYNDDDTGRGGYNIICNTSYVIGDGGRGDF